MSGPTRSDRRGKRAVARRSRSSANPSSTKTSPPGHRQSTAPKLAAEALPLCLDDDQKLLAQVVAYYQRTLKETTDALDYLRRRGVTVGEAIERFRIGYANRTLGLRLPAMVTKAGREIRTRLQELGLYRGTGREHFNGCVTFPITTAEAAAEAASSANLAKSICAAFLSRCLPTCRPTFAAESRWCAIASATAHQSALLKLSFPSVQPPGGRHPGLPWAHSSSWRSLPVVLAPNAGCCAILASVWATATRSPNRVTSSGISSTLRP